MIALLDHGYLKLIEHWGSDERIIESARMSTGKGFLGWESDTCPNCQGSGVKMQNATTWDATPYLYWEYHELMLNYGDWHEVQQELPCPVCHGKKTIPGDARLLRFLHNKKHTTPFEMGGMLVEVQAPIMVFREWHRHRTQSYSELSARYTPMPDVNYVPTVERCMQSNSANKQASSVAGAEVLTEEKANIWQQMLAVHYRHAETIYRYGLSIGIPKELARLCVPVGRYSRMRASANLLNWLRFLALRMPEDAQYEIRMFAHAVGGLIAERFPRTWELFSETMAKKE